MTTLHSSPALMQRPCRYIMASIIRSVGVPRLHRCICMPCRNRSDLSVFVACLKLASLKYAGFCLFGFHRSCRYPTSNSLAFCMQQYMRCVQTYVTNINAQMDKFPELKDLGLVTLNQSIGSSKIPKEAATAVRYCSTAPCSLCCRMRCVYWTLQEQWGRTLESLFLLEGTVCTTVC